MQMDDLDARQESHLEPSSLGLYRTGTGQYSRLMESPTLGDSLPGTPTTLLVRDVMSSKVVSIPKTASLKQAVEALNRHCISGLPVTDDENHPVGILSEKDILRTLRELVGLSFPKSLWDLLLTSERGEREDVRRKLLQALETNRVQQAMSAPPVTVGPEVTVHQALRTMIHRGFHRLVVVESGKMVGIVTRRDILASMVPGV